MSVDKLSKLLQRCKCGVFLIVNEHRDSYQTAAEFLKELKDRDQIQDGDIAEDVLKAMVETDTIVSLQFYPDTPIRSYSIYHHDLNSALDEALACLDKQEAA